MHTSLHTCPIPQSLPGGAPVEAAALCHHLKVQQEIPYLLPSLLHCLALLSQFPERIPKEKPPPYLLGFLCSTSNRPSRISVDSFY